MRVRARTRIRPPMRTLPRSSLNMRSRRFSRPMADLLVARCGGGGAGRISAEAVRAPGVGDLERVRRQASAGARDRHRGRCGLLDLPSHLVLDEGSLALEVGLTIVLQLEAGERGVEEAHPEQD